MIVSQNEQEPNSDLNVRLLTINMFMRPPLVNTNGDDYKEERLQFFVNNYLANFDVVCF